MPFNTTTSKYTCVDAGLLGGELHLTVASTDFAVMVCEGAFVH